MLGRIIFALGELHVKNRLTARVYPTALPWAISVSDFQAYAHIPPTDARTGSHTVPVIYHPFGVGDITLRRGHGAIYGKGRM